MHRALNAGPVAARNHIPITRTSPLCRNSRTVDVHNAAQFARWRWSEFKHSRTVRVDRLTFVQNTLENSWTDLAMLDLGSPVTRPCLRIHAFAKPSPADAAAAGVICYQAFYDINTAHNFPPDLPSPEAGIGVLTMMFSHPGFYCVVAESDGRIIGSNCLDERSPIAGVGPITVETGAQNAGAGRKLMDAVLAARRRAQVHRSPPAASRLSQPLAIALHQVGLRCPGAHLDHARPAHSEDHGRLSRPSRAQVRSRSLQPRVAAKSTATTAAANLPTPSSRAPRK